LLVVAWLFATPPGAAPDESQHYVKALATAQGDLTGLATTRLTAAVTNPTQGALLLRQTRLMRVPAALAPPASWQCTVADHRASAACTVPGPGSDDRAIALTPSYVGNYIPVVYALPGLVATLAHRPTTAGLLGRAAIATLATCLLVVAVVGSWAPGRPGTSAPTTWPGRSRRPWPRPVLYSSRTWERRATASVKRRAPACM